MWEQIEAEVRMLQDDFAEHDSSVKEQYWIPDFTLELESEFVERISVDGVLLKDTVSRIREKGFMCGMAGELEIKMIAEGVEAEELVEFLRSVGCDIVQGTFCEVKPIRRF